MVLQFHSPTQTALHLQLAPNFIPEADSIFAGNGLACYGMPGSGKSNFLSLLCEQYVRFQLPLLLLDTEGESEDLLSVFPRGVLANKQNLPDPAAILHDGLQVILNLKSWEDEYEDAAYVVGGFIESLFEIAGAQAPLDRVPCPILMDEAATWLPRRTLPVSHLSKEAKTYLLTTFAKLGARGRKYGLIPHYFTQYISQIDADVIRGCQLRVLMKQSGPLDFKRYADFIPMAQAKETARFLPGEAIISGLGEPLHVRFYEQETEHPSQTPKVQAALAKFAPAGYTMTPPALSHSHTVEHTTPLLFSRFQHRAKQGGIPGSDAILAYVAKNQQETDLQKIPTNRNLARYIKSLTKEELQATIAHLLTTGHITEQKIGRATVYLLPTQVEAVN